jgi:hypothetical protein
MAFTCLREDGTSPPSVEFGGQFDPPPILADHRLT